MPVIQQSKGFLHEEGVALSAVIVDIIEDDGKFGPQLKFIIEVDGDGVDDDGEPKNVWAFTSQNYSNKSKLGLWAAQILGSMPEELDTDDLVGRNVNITFERYVRIDDSGQPQEKEKVVNITAA